MLSSLQKTGGENMTQRERQIPEWIEKGYITGKGIPLSSGSYAVVAGGVNIDIGGRSFSPLIPKDSNPGRVTMSLGGVGRNIAHNLSLLGVNVRFLTAFGDDVYARRIGASCAELGIDISHALQVPGGTTSTYLFFNDWDGDMALALSDMEICEKLTPAYFASNLSILNNARLVIMDTNLPGESLTYLADHCTAPIFADPVSTKKAARLKPVLGKIHTLKPNLIEAELLSGVEITDTRSLEHAAQVLLDTGLRQVFISMGRTGVFAADHEKMMTLPCFPAEMKNATGAGDAFMAALAWAYLEGNDLESTCRAASAAAAFAVESDETINPALSADIIRRRMKQ